MIQSKRDAVVERPFAYAYRYSASPPQGATVVRFETHGREINGSKPIAVIPLFTYEQALALAKQQSLVVDEELVERASNAYFAAYDSAEGRDGKPMFKHLQGIRAVLSILANR